MWGHPGKKLLFMGGEIAQWSEWNHDASIDWNLLDYDSHRGIQTLVRDLNALYRENHALHERDSISSGFRWVIGNDTANSVFAFLRQGHDEGRVVLVVCNMTPVPRVGYGIGVPRPGFWRELLNTDASIYGGSNMGNNGGVNTVPVQMHGEAQSLSLTLPPLAVLYLALD
jgi:1,4-alpha-glucan branching enzyme